MSKNIFRVMKTVVKTINDDIAITSIRLKYIRNISVIFSDHDSRIRQELFISQLLDGRSINGVKKITTELGYTSILSHLCNEVLDEKYLRKIGIPENVDILIIEYWLNEWLNNKYNCYAYSDGYTYKVYYYLK